MSKFFVPKRFDANLATSGQWFSIYDDSDQYYGRFKLKLLDATTKEGELAYKRIRQKHAADIRTKKLSPYDNIRICLIEGALLDWDLATDPNDPKAKSIPYTQADAMEYFSMEDTKWIAHKLSDLAATASNFLGEEAPATPDEVAGN